jgi:hypothetical protein
MPYNLACGHTVGLEAGELLTLFGYITGQHLPSRCSDWHVVTVWDRIWHPALCFKLPSMAACVFTYNSVWQTFRQQPTIIGDVVAMVAGCYQQRWQNIAYARCAWLSVHECVIRVQRIPRWPKQW